MSNTLLPCPFCGGESFLYGAGAAFWTGCLKCRVDTPILETEEKAIAAWNRRTGKDINVATNADHIRNMSNMELAEMLVRYDSNLYRYYCPDGSFCDDEDSALSFALDWLDKPAKEE